MFVFKENISTRFKYYPLAGACFCEKKKEKLKTKATFAFAYARSAHSFYSY